MLASRSLSPNRNRRHSIFSHSNSRKNLEGSAGSTFQLQQSLRLQAVAPSPMALQKVRREILAMCEKQTNILIGQINEHQLHIHQLEVKLAESERHLQHKSQQLEMLEQKSILASSQQNKQHFERLLTEELSKRMQVVTTRFEQLEELFVQNVYGRNKTQLSIRVRSPRGPPSPIHPVDHEYQQLREQTDIKLQAIVEDNRRHQQDLKNACSNMHQQLLELEHAMQKIYSGFKSINTKAQRCYMGLQLAQQKCSELQKGVKRTMKTVSNTNHQQEFQSFYEDEPRMIVEQPQPQLRSNVSLKSKGARQPVSPFETELGNIPSLEPSGETTIIYPRRVDNILQQLEQRLRRTVIGKKIPTPIPVFLDDQYFIRKADGAYLFDMDGDIFKTTLQEFNRLCQLRLLVNLEG